MRPVDSENDLLAACTLPNDGVDDMFEDLDQPQQQPYLVHSSSGSDVASGAMFSTAPAILGRNGSHTMPTQPTEQPRQQFSMSELNRSSSERPAGFLGGLNVAAPSAGQWFPSASVQPQQHSEPLTEPDSMSRLSYEQLISDTGPGSASQLSGTQQQWTPTAGDQNAALAMLLSRSKPSPDNAGQAAAANPLAPLLANLTPEQQQLLVNADLNLPLLLQAARSPDLAASKDPQLDIAEAIWHQVAASGADDQTLLSLAANLGLISQDPVSGSVMLTRELGERQQALSVATRLQQNIAAALSSPQGHNGARSRSAILAGVAGQGGSSPRSSPLPRLSQPGLAALLALQASGASGLRLPMSSPQVKVGNSPGPSKQHTLYKTELCRGWLEAGTCRYGSKCQFAHGREELRPVPRHPKYKTEVCRSFTATGVCAYGPRCRFIHGAVSTPINAIFDSATMSGLAARDPGSMEGVFGFDDLLPASASTPGSAAARGASTASLLAGGSAALRQASGTPVGAGSDAASMARLAARLLAVGGRTSLDSAMSFGTNSNRPSWSDAATRTSMDSRVGGNGNGLPAAAGGRMSLDSGISQAEAYVAREAAGFYPSPDAYAAAAGGGATLTSEALLSLAAAGGQLGHQQQHPYMPGIPEAFPMNMNVLQRDPWQGGVAAGVQSQPAAQPLRAAGGANVPFHFMMPRSASGPGATVANEPQAPSNVYLSAFKSGLYSMGAPVARAGSPLTGGMPGSAPQDRREGDL